MPEGQITPLWNKIEKERKSISKIKSEFRQKLSKVHRKFKSMKSKMEKFTFDEYFPSDLKQANYE